MTVRTRLPELPEGIVLRSLSHVGPFVPAFSPSLRTRTYLASSWPYRLW